MDSTEFKEAIRGVSDEITTYVENVGDRRVMSTVEPGYLQKLLPDSPPDDGEKWEEIRRDIESKIMPGMTHWNSPNFMAYYPAPTSYPSMLGELYASAMNVPAFNWECAPAITELEIIVMDWVVKMLNLPPCFLSSSGSGGGVISGTTSEAVLNVMVAARDRCLDITTGHLHGEARESAMAQRRMRMVALGSEASHSCTQKAAMILGIRYMPVPVFIEDDFSMRGDMLAQTLLHCRMLGLEPFYLTATLGTTATCAIDRIDEIANAVSGQNIWVHVDAAYAGAALVCEEYLSLTHHLASFDSFSMSMSKWLLTNLDAVCCFLKYKHNLIDAMSITPPYLRNDASDSGKVTDYRHWGVPLTRRFRALKIWFVMRSYGVNGFKSYVRNHIALGSLFSSLVATRSDIFKIVTLPAFALTVISIIPRLPTLLRVLVEKKAEESWFSKAHGTCSLCLSKVEPEAFGRSTANKDLIGIGSASPYDQNREDRNTSIDARFRTHVPSFYEAHHHTNREPHANSKPWTIGQARTSSKTWTNGDDSVNRVVNNVPKNLCLPNADTPSTSDDEGSFVSSNGACSASNNKASTPETSANSSVSGDSSSSRNSIKKPSQTDDLLTDYANLLTKTVYERINRQGEIMLTSTVIGGLFVIRVNTANPKTEEKYVRRAFDILVEVAEKVLGEQGVGGRRMMAVLPVKLGILSLAYLTWKCVEERVFV